VKLLFDANLSPALVARLRAEYPGSTHVRDIGLRAAMDVQIWEYAKAHGFAIVSKDTDFRERSFVEGFPPKVIWLDVGNAGTTLIVALLQSERARVEQFDASNDASLLILSIGTSAV
jgi:predicted nuclease of predicted toxin-antitoxin system